MTTLVTQVVPGVLLTVAAFFTGLFAHSVFRIWQLRWRAWRSRTYPPGLFCGLLVVLSLVAVSCGFADPFDLKEKPMPTLPEQAATCQKAQMFGQAALLWRRAADEPGADPELCLGRCAECQFRYGALDSALATCDELERKTPQSQAAPYVRGLVLQQRNDPKARHEFEVAHFRGHPLAEYQLKNAVQGAAR